MDSPSCMQPYSRTKEFTETSVPQTLLNAHMTKGCARALIHVRAAGLAYRIGDPRRPASEAVLTAQTPPGVVEPTILHSVEPLGPVRFYVEFHRHEHP